MGRELAEPDWLPLTGDELRGIPGRRDPARPAARGADDSGWISGQNLPADGGLLP